MSAFEFDGWKELHSSFSFDPIEKKLKVSYYKNIADITDISSLPIKGNPCMHPMFEDYLMNKTSFSKVDGGKQYKMDVEYIQSTPINLDPQYPNTPKPHWGLDFGSSDRDIYLHENFKMNWVNFCILKKGGTAPTKSEWEDAVNGESDDGKDWRWSLDADGIDPEKEYVFRSPRFENYETYANSAPVVTAQYTCRSISQVKKLVEKVNIIEAPAETYGLTGDWLRTPQSVDQPNPDVDEWKVTVSWQLSPTTINTEMYKDPSGNYKDMP